MAVLTQGREVSTSLRRIPATALSADVCRPGQMCWPVPTRSALTISETGEHRASTPSRPNVRPREAFLEFKMGLLNYLAQELQKVTHHNEIGGERRAGRSGGWSSSLPLTWHRATCQACRMQHAPTLFIHTPQPQV